MKNLSDEQLDQLLTRMKWTDSTERYDATQDHPVDDVALLEAWELGNLSDGELRELDNHLNQCHYCRSEVAAMIKNETLNFQNHSTSKPTVVGKWYDLRQAPAWILVAASITLVVVCISVLSFQGGTDIARNDLVLKQKTLTDFGYNLRGMPSGIKGGDDEPDSAEEQRFRDLIARNPDDVKLRFEYGQWLLAKYKLSDAIEQFEHVEKSAPKSAVVQNALGMAWFMKETGQGNPPVIARGHFLEALIQAPNDKAINLNLAICLTVLGDEAGAKEYFEKAEISQ